MSLRSKIHSFGFGLAVSACALLFSPLTPAMVGDVQAEVDPQPSPRGLVLLKNGRILRGTAVREGDVVVIRLLGGELRVPTDQVYLVCDSLDEAYRIQQSELTSSDPDAHVQLARWCLSNGLSGYARDELNAALQIDPDRRDVRVMLNRLPRRAPQPLPEVNARAIAPPKSFERPRAPIRLLEETTNLEATTTSNLPHLARKAFAVSIQPVLFESCALSGCHNAKATRTFRLEPLGRSRRDERETLETNLRTVLSYVDFERPAESPILLISMRAHGRAKHAMFSDPNQLEYRKLAAWVFAVCDQEDRAKSMLPELPEKAAQPPGPTPIEDLPANVKQSFDTFTLPSIGKTKENPSDKQDDRDETNPYDLDSADQKFLKKLLETLGKRKK